MRGYVYHIGTRELEAIIEGTNNERIEAICNDNFDDNDYGLTYCEPTVNGAGGQVIYLDNCPVLTR